MSWVNAIDIVTDSLHPSLRCAKMKDKVIPILGIDARNLIPIEEKLVIYTTDVTFTSLRAILPNIKWFLKKNGDITTLVKLWVFEKYRNKNFWYKEGISLRQIPFLYKI